MDEVKIIGRSEIRFIMIFFFSLCSPFRGGVSGVALAKDAQDRFWWLW